MSIWTDGFVRQYLTLDVNKIPKKFYQLKITLNPRNSAGDNAGIKGFAVAASQNKNEAVVEKGKYEFKEDKNGDPPAPDGCCFLIKNIAAAAALTATLAANKVETRDIPFLRHFFRGFGFSCLN